MRGESWIRLQVRALAERWATEAVAAGRVEVFDELVSADAVDHSGPKPVSGVDGFKLRTGAVHASFTEIAVTVEDVLVDEDRIAWRWRLTGTHSGPFAGVAPTGKHVAMSGMNIQRVENGRVVEHWSNSDQLGLLRQVQAS